MEGISDDDVANFRPVALWPCMLGRDFFELLCIVRLHAQIPDANQIPYTYAKCQARTVHGESGVHEWNNHIRKFKFRVRFPDS